MPHDGRARALPVAVAESIIVATWRAPPGLLRQAVAVSTRPSTYTTLAEKASKWVLSLCYLLCFPVG